MSEDRQEKEKDKSGENSECEEEEEEIEESLSEGHKLLNYMGDVYERIMLGCGQDDKVIIVSKNGNLIKSNIKHEKALESSSCILNFSDKARITLQKIFPDEPIQFIRIKGRKNYEIINFNDENLEMIVIQNNVGF